MTVKQDRKLDLILCWHMHQPDYRNYMSGEFELPWTYLHAMKDYTDMVYHLEQSPKSKAVFNFVPILLDQLEAYIADFDCNKMSDPLLRLLAHEDMNSIGDAQRKLILEKCFRCNHVTMVHPFPSYKRLQDFFNVIDAQGEACMSYLSGQYLADLLVWYHLAWTGESVRREHALVTQLMAKGEHFSYSDRMGLYDLIGNLMRGLIPRYKALVKSGRIELSSTPHYHPISPLLIDFKAARECTPNVDLPESPSYPGGKSRVAFHIESAIASHEARFGEKPHGFWPAEGGVSDPLLNLLAHYGVRWTATGEGVLVSSLRKAHPGSPVPEKKQYLYRPYQVTGQEKKITCFFRDDHLSDLIGFEYAKWYGRDAVNHFVHLLEGIIEQAPEGENPVVSVILDGENAWEYYPYNGYFFLSELYEALSAHPFINMTTFKDYLDAAEKSEPAAACKADSGNFATMGRLPGLVAGSWVYGDFSTWIGSADKNRAWDLLCAAKRSFDHVIASGRLTKAEQEAAYKQLSDCESSDWFWWFGDYNPKNSVESFDKLYRENLTNLYQLLKLEVPEVLSLPVSHGGGHAEAGGAMRRAS